MKERARGPKDAGTGLIAMIGSLLVFLGFVFFAVNLLVGLYAASTITAVTNDAATSVASADVDHRDPRAVAAARLDAERRWYDELGGLSERVERFDWSGSDADTVRLQVRVRNPRLAFGTDAFGLAVVDRTVEVRVERFR